MADDLGDEWWENQPAGAASSPELTEKGHVWEPRRIVPCCMYHTVGGVPGDKWRTMKASDGEGRGDTEMMQQETAPVPALSKKTRQVTVLWESHNCWILESSSTPLQHSLFFNIICPKWVKLRKNHNEKKSVLMLIICSSALRALELIRSMTAFRGDSKVMKLFAKHIKVQEQVKLLEKRVVHLGVGTPGRIKELIKQGGLNLNPLKFLVFDWNWRDQKLRRMMDIPEIRKEVFELLEMGVLSLCKSESLKLGLF
uniref:protein CMSS1 n=1 Tax=Panthera onca TaxID=9690 RepID=UPI002954013B|nr:protein CMSS1 [Panthera onca]